ncbi:MAG: hypothetical protein A3K03_04605 [Bdellovibrionales bacterium RIFOXYD1_FULL_44_7]|nr:MAG: hypothetical protein A3K03_04605 [Bdellovibrionales bacterium RIFOXYD1_FULL_44_7]
MENILDKIYEALQRLIGLHRQMLETVRLERECLAQADLKGIHEATCAKEAIIATISQAEIQRVKATAELALVWKKPIKELTLPTIIIAIQTTDTKRSESLRSSFNALTFLIQRIKEQNNENRELVEKSLEHVANMKRNILGVAHPTNQTYTAKGRKTEKTGQSRLLSKEI